MMHWIEKAQPPFVIIENVSGAPWDKKVELFQEHGYGTYHTDRNTRKCLLCLESNVAFLLQPRHFTGSTPKTSEFSAAVF